MKPNEVRPLAGTRILVGRARHQASRLSEGLRSLGASVIEVPFIEIRKPESFEPMDNALKNLKSYDWLILTSVNGVKALSERRRKLRLTRRHFKHLQIAAIGPATKAALVKSGLKVKMMPEEYVAESVV
jgi:uroporphyrinogen-III synthase